MNNNATVLDEKLRIDDLFKRVSKLSSNDVIIFAPYFGLNKDGTQMVPQKVAKQLLANSPAPIFTVNDTLFLPGMIGGYVISAEELGKRLVDFAYVPNFFWDAKDFHYCGFDYNALQRWNIESINLPSRSRVINKPEKGYFEKLLLKLFPESSREKTPLDKVCN